MARAAEKPDVRAIQRCAAVLQLDTVIDELRDISNAWLARQQVGEKGFSVAAFTPDFIYAQPVALLRQHRRPIGFATVMTTDTKQEMTVGLMRYRPGEASRHAMK